MNVLLLEDEMDISKSLVILFESQGWTVRVLHTIADLNTLLVQKSFYPQVIVLDRNIHGTDSASYVQKIKNAFADSKILVLSAIDTSTEKAKLLDLGADDYVAKPFSGPELVARMKALSRRTVLVSSLENLSLGNIKVDLGQRSVEIAGVSTGLSQKEYQLLNLFMNAPGKVFPKEILLEKVWNVKSEVESKVVEATMNNLRRKLESAKASVQIKNSRNVGYWLET